MYLKLYMIMDNTCAEVIKIITGFLVFYFIETKVFNCRLFLLSNYNYEM